jgi:hypothetical protein
LLEPAMDGCQHDLDASERSPRMIDIHRSTT